MELNYKNSFRINIINLIVNLLMIVSSVFTIFEIKEQFEFIELVVVVYSILYEIVMFVTIYAGILERNLPEFLEFMENGYVQILGFVLINLLLMDLSLVSLIIGSLILTYSIIFTIYNFCTNKN